MPQKALLEALLARLRPPLYVGMDGGLQRARECVTFSETSKKPSLTWQLYVYAEQGRRNTFYFGGGANFGYQNMDAASTRFTSVARKLLGGLPSPMVPTPMLRPPPILGAIAILYFGTNCSRSCTHIARLKSNASQLSTLNWVTPCTFPTCKYAASYVAVDKE